MNGPSADVETQAGVVVRRVGHDLRNKLSVLRNSTYYLDMKLRGQNERVDKHLRLLEREVGALNRMILDLMDLVSAKPPILAEADINAVVTRALEETPAPEGVQSSLALSPNPPPVRLDVDQVTHALGNLLSYQYSTLRAGGTLRVITRAEPRRVCIDCIDSGAGLEAEQLAQLLEAQGQDGFAPALMGVLVARRLVAQSGGHLQAESRVGAGTRFGLAFPLSAA
jgi:signal transduction histidine kinase